MSDDKKAILQEPRGASTVYHLADEDDGERPKCNSAIDLGEWTVRTIEDVPDQYDKCQKCNGEVTQAIDENGRSLVWRARHGEPEDFGLEPIPDEAMRYRDYI